MEKTNAHKIKNAAILVKKIFVLFSLSLKMFLNNLDYNELLKGLQFYNIICHTVLL